MRERKKARCFVLDQYRMVEHDKDKIAVHGEPVFLLTRLDHRPSMWVDDFCTVVLEKLQAHDYDPENDYFVVAGSTVAVTKAITIIVRAYGGAKVLFYDVKRSAYVSQYVGGLLDGQSPSELVSSHS
jgi:hypothetical protein